MRRCAELYTKDRKYDLNFKVQPNDGKQILTGGQLLDLYASWAEKYPIVSIEVCACPCVVSASLALDSRPTCLFGFTHTCSL